MTVQYKCEKHGFLSKDERVMWSNRTDNRWCIHCVNEMMNKYCGQLIKIEENSIIKKE